MNDSYEIFHPTVAEGNQATVLSGPNLVDASLLIMADSSD
jgi:hypothetical protein